MCASLYKMVNSYRYISGSNDCLQKFFTQNKTLHSIKMSDKKNKKYFRKNFTLERPFDRELHELRDSINASIEEASRRNLENPFLFPRPPPSGSFPHLVRSTSNLRSLLISMLPLSEIQISAAFLWSLNGTIISNFF